VQKGKCSTKFKRGNHITWCSPSHPAARDPHHVVDTIPSGSKRTTSRASHPAAREPHHVVGGRRAGTEGEGSFHSHSRSVERGSKRATL
jgi:hypothetical protein